MLGFEMPKKFKFDEFQNISQKRSNIGVARRYLFIVPQTLSGYSRKDNDLECGEQLKLAIIIPSISQSNSIFKDDQEMIGDIPLRLLKIACPNRKEFFEPKLNCNRATSWV